MWLVRKSRVLQFTFAVIDEAPSSGTDIYPLYGLATDPRDSKRRKKPRCSEHRVWLAANNVHKNTELEFLCKAAMRLVGSVRISRAREEQEDTMDGVWP